jgi:hypothetical protein
MPWVPKGSLRRNRDDFEFKHDLVEVSVLRGDESTPEEREALDAIYTFMTDKFDRTFRIRLSGRLTEGATFARARYRELRRTGLGKKQALEELMAVVRWCKREWWSRPDMRAYCKPDSIFRKRKFHERRGA